MSRFLAARLVALGLASDPVVIPNVVPPSVPAPTARRKPHVIAHVSIMGPAKNLGALLQRVGALRRRRSDFELRLIGDGESRAGLEQLAGTLGLGDIVRFVGRVPAADIPAHLAEAAFTVVSSTHETFSVSAAESLMCGRPVLSTRCGGPRGVPHSRGRATCRARKCRKRWWRASTGCSITSASSNLRTCITTPTSGSRRTSSPSGSSTCIVRCSVTLETPRFSVTVPAYNAERTLAETLESVLAQTFRDWELVVVDDGSTDGTRALAEHFAARDPRVRVFTQENRGSGGAYNAAVAPSARRPGGDAVVRRPAPTGPPGHVRRRRARRPRRLGVHVRRLVRI